MEYGLRIPLYDKQGKKLLHARLASELEALGRNVLRRIVEMYDREKGYKLFDTLKTDTAVARWIERVETLALGPHPESTLPCKLSHPGYYYYHADCVVATEKEDLLIALKFKKAPHGQTKNDAAGKKLNPQQADSLPKAKAPQQADLPPKSKAPQSQTEHNAPGKKLGLPKAAAPPKAKAQSQTKQDAPEKKLNPPKASPAPKTKATQSQNKQDASEKKLNPQSQAKQDAPGKQPDPQKTASLQKVKAPQRQPKQDAPEKKLNSPKASPAPKAKASTKPGAPPAPSAERKKEQELAKPSPISLQGQAHKNKRQRDENAATTDATQTPAKKKKRLATPVPKPESTEESDLELEQALEQELAKQSSTPPQATPAKNKRKHDGHAAPSNAPETPGKKRRTDAASPTTSSPPLSTPPPSTAKATNPQAPSPQPALSRPPTPHHTNEEAPKEPLEEYDLDKAPSDEEPFRAPGIHGPHGSFTNSPSLFTGRGHQVPPSEWTLNLQYQAHRYNFYNHLCPFFPYVDRQRRIRADENNTPGLKTLREMEVWMGAYRERWPGECVGHLWDCGCVNLGYYEKVGGGEVSEEE